MLVIAAVFLVAVSVPYAYILLTGRWISWPLRPKWVPATARHRRLAAAGMLLVLLPLAVDSAASSLFGPTMLPGHIFGVVIRGGMLLLILLGSVMLVMMLMRGMIADVTKRYGLEGWPPPTASGPGKR